MMLTNDDLAFIERCEAKNVSDPQAFGLDLGRLHALYMRALPEERGRLVKLLNPAGTLTSEPQGEPKPKHEGDDKLAEGARLAQKWNQRGHTPVQID